MADTKLHLPTGWAKVADYLFGRNALIAVASFMLLMISGYATWAGMHDFIIGVASSGPSPGRDTPGGFSVSHDFLVGAIVVALTFLMWLALRESFGAGRKWRERAITLPLYVFLALWSIGFGYGFWWSLIAGQEATKTGIAGLQEDARDAGSAITARLDAVRLQLDSVVTWSDGQMAREETSGGSCGVASGAGRGPLYNARRSVRDSISTLRDGVAKTWLGPVQDDLKAMQQSAVADDGSGDVAERQRRFEARAGDIRGRSRSIAQRSNELGKSTATEMRAIAAAVSVQPNQTGFSCYDPTLAQRLKQAADQADQSATLKLRDAAFNEGPAGTANAIKNLWQNMGSYMGGLVRYVASGGKAGDGTTSAGQPITGRDMIALLATIGIDLGLLVLALLDPPTAPPVRRDGLRETASNLHEVDSKVKVQIRGAIDTVVARIPLPAGSGRPGDSERAAKLEWVHRHFIHHNGISYFVTPNLHSAGRAPKGEEQPATQVDLKGEELRALAINQLAGVFSDVKLIRVLSVEELLKLGDEERRDSYTDLARIQKEHESGAGRSAKPGRSPGMFGKKADETFGEGMRNHALLSKAKRALDIAEWSERAQEDFEIYRLTDTEGLTPILDVLTDLERGGDAKVAAASKPSLMLEKPQV